MTRCRLRTTTLSSDETRDGANEEVSSLDVGGRTGGVAAMG